jgi:hypothetical protein
MAFLNPFQPPLPTGRQAQTMKIPLYPPEAVKKFSYNGVLVF